MAPIECQILVQKFIECKLHTSNIQGTSLCCLLLYNLSKLGADYIFGGPSCALSQVFPVLSLEKKAALTRIYGVAQKQTSDIKVIGKLHLARPFP